MTFIDPELLADLENSSCFSIAHDPTAKECKMCDLQQECALKSANNNLYDKIKVLSPETEKALKEAEEKRNKRNTGDTDEKAARKLRKQRRKEERERIGMPDTKQMNVEELWELLKSKGGDCEVYEDPKVQRMRLTIAIKQKYVEEYEKENGSI